MPSRFSKKSRARSWNPVAVQYSCGHHTAQFSMHAVCGYDFGGWQLVASTHLIRQFRVVDALGLGEFAPGWKSWKHEGNRWKAHPRVVGPKHLELRAVARLGPVGVA